MLDSLLVILRTAYRLSRLMSPLDVFRLVRKSNRQGLIDIHLTGEHQNIVLRGATTDIQCFEKIFIKREYACPFPVAPKFIIDAGANIGLSSLYFATTYPDATIFAIEPEADNFRFLQRNCAGLDRVKTIRGALWSSQGQVSVTEAFDGGAWTFSVERQGKPSLETVPAFSVPQLLEIAGHTHVDILKLDVEGSEKAIFTGNTDWLDHIGILSIELHDRFVPDCSRAVYRKVTERPFRQEIRGENIFILLR